MKLSNDLIQRTLARSRACSSPELGVPWHAWLACACWRSKKRRAAWGFGVASSQQRRFGPEQQSNARPLPLRECTGCWRAGALPGSVSSASIAVRARSRRYAGVLLGACSMSTGVLSTSVMSRGRHTVANTNTGIAPLKPSKWAKQSVVYANGLPCTCCSLAPLPFACDVGSDASNLRSVGAAVHD